MYSVTLVNRTEGCKRKGRGPKGATLRSTALLKAIALLRGNCRATIQQVFVGYGQKSK